jgi:hypothetical protein
VRKHGLSLSRCFLGVGIRLTMTLVAALPSFERGMLSRAIGNLEGLLAFLTEARKGSPTL